MMQKLKALKGYAYGMSLAATSAMGLLAAKAASALTVNDLDTTGISNNIQLGTASPVELAVTVINWVLGILAVLGLAGLVVFAILWNKEKKANGAKTVVASDGTTVTVPPAVAAATTTAVAVEAAAARKTAKTNASYSA